MSILEYIKTGDVKKVAQLMIEPSRDFTGGVYHYNFDQPTLDVEHMLISVTGFINTMFKLDDFAIKVNEIIQEKFPHAWDEEVLDYLVKQDYDIRSDYRGYSYNYPNDCRLDRDIHYNLFEYKGDPYILLLVHYGADARAGFGEMVCFKVRSVDYFYLGQDIEVFDRETDEDYNAWEVEDIATYNKETNEWVHNETGRVLSIHAIAEGF